MEPLLCTNLLNEENLHCCLCKRAAFVSNKGQATTQSPKSDPLEVSSEIFSTDETLIINFATFASAVVNSQEGRLLKPKYTVRC